MYCEHKAAKFNSMETAKVIQFYPYGGGISRRGKQKAPMPNGGHATKLFRANNVAVDAE